MPTAARAKDAATGAADKAKDTADTATGTVTGSLDSLGKQAIGAFTQSAKDILGPAFQQMGEQAANQATEFLKEQGPQLVREQVMPAVLKNAGVTDVSELPQRAMGKVGEAMSGAGGLTGIAGKLMSKLGGRGGRGKGVATGYGQGRRIMIQQIQYVPVNVKDVYRAWTQSEWPQYMHRINTLDRQTGEETGEESRYSIGVKGLFFKKSFTAQIQEQVPFRFIVWRTTQGNIKNTGRVSFHGEGEDLTLMILNLDMAPSGVKEKMVRGFRYHKRGIRSDFHRFSAWIQMRTQDELDELEGDLSTIEGGKIIQSHEEYVEEHPEEQDRGAESEDEEYEEEPLGEAEYEEYEEEETVEEEPEEEVEEEEEPEEEVEEEEEPEEEVEEEEEPEAEEEDVEEEPEEEEVEEEPKPLPTPRRRSGRSRTKAKPKPKAKPAPRRRSRSSA